MSPYFEQYASALRRGIEKIISGKETEKSIVQARIDELTQQIDGLQKQQATTGEEIGQLTQSLDVFATLPQVDIFVPGTENGPLTLSDFAKQATQERLESTTPSSQESAEKKLQSLFQINQLLNNSGIDTTRQIRLGINNDSLTTNGEIQIRGKIIKLTPREKDVYNVLELHEGSRINYRDISEQVPNISKQQIGSIIQAIRRKIEDDPTHPKHIIGKKGGYGVGGITFTKSP